MKTLLAGLLFISLPVHAGLWDLYDGDGTTPLGKYFSQSGVTCDSYNEMAGFAWRKKGGDWVDAGGVMHGTVPQVSAKVAKSTKPQRIVMDYTPLLGSAGVIWRRANGAVMKIATRESATPPVLRVTMADGSVQALPATADASLLFSGPDRCSITPTGTGTTATVNPSVVMGFGTIPEGAVSAELELTILSASLATSLQGFAMVVPRQDRYVSAPPVVDDPGVIWRLTFDEYPRPCDRWWEASGRKPNAQWKQDDGLFIVPGGSGLWCATGDPEPVSAQGTDGTVKVQRGTGAVGNGLMAVYHPNTLAAGVDLLNPQLRTLAGGSINEAWFSYYVKFGEDFHSFAKCEGGKMPGLAGPTQPTATFCGNSSRDANGLCGWSLRESYKVECDPKNPAWGGVQAYTYAYHGLMSGFYGQTWSGNELRRLERGKWHCIEQHLTMNTDDVDDGLLQVYVNGLLAFSKSDVYLRGKRPPQGYGNWKNASKYPIQAGAVTRLDSFGRTLWSVGPYSETADNGIVTAFLAIHNGGATPPGKTAQVWYDEFTVSRQRAGCPERVEK